jgi:hypothetical protein
MNGRRMLKIYTTAFKIDPEWLAFDLGKGLPVVSLVHQLDPDRGRIVA